MKQTLALITTLSLFGSVVALAAPQGKTIKKPAKPAVKVVDVWTCPSTGEAVTDKNDKGVVVGSYRAHFCCPGCAPAFNKLNQKEKLAKLAELAQKEAGGKKGNHKVVKPGV